MFRYWHDSLELQLSAMSAYLKIYPTARPPVNIAATILGLFWFRWYFLRQVSGPVELGLFCWQMPFLEIGFLQKKFFLFVATSLPSRQISLTRGTQTRIIARCFHIKTFFHVFHNILNNAIPARRRFATTDVTIFLGSHWQLKHFKGFIFFIELPATSWNAHAYFFLI